MATDLMIDMSQIPTYQEIIDANLPGQAYVAYRAVELAAKFARECAATAESIKQHNEFIQVALTHEFYMRTMVAAAKSGRFRCQADLIHYTEGAVHLHTIS